MSLVLDAGALIALERNDRRMWIRLKSSLLDGDLPVTHAGVVGQVWRGGPRQARLAQALASIEIRPLDEKLGKTSGQLLGAAGMSDAIDAAVIVLAQDGDEVITSDPLDLAQLATTRGCYIELVEP